MLQQTNSEGEAFVSLSHASKFYGSFAALKDVSFSLMPGEVHMLLGENGAGKSTLVSLLTGENRLDEGERYLRGEAAPSLTPHEAREAGINSVLQDFALSPTLTVAENFSLGREVTRYGLLSKEQMREEFVQMASRLGVALDPDQLVSRLSRAEQQLLEILRALGGKPGSLILDEPTATLSHEETEHLFETVRTLKDEGWAILYISHRMEEIRKLGDVVTILRDGRMMSRHRLSDVSNDQMITDMVGREIQDLYPDIPAQPGELALEVKNLSSAGKLNNATIDVRFGEIVGVGGLVGCGKEDLVRVLFGLNEMTGGHISLHDRPIPKPSPATMLAEGLIYLPQDRRGEALTLNRTIADNIVLEVLGQPEGATLGFLNNFWLSELVAKLLQHLNISPPNPNKKVQELSGGNQQKVVLARALSRPRQVYVFEEPTAGVDVGARRDFYIQLQNLCADGAAILLVTSDLQELVHLSHRVFVMHQGHCVAELESELISEDVIAAYAFGETPKETQGII